MLKFLSAEPLHDPLATAPLADTQVRHTTCYMCACRCGIRVHLREGEHGPEVRYIDGNPEHPLNQGVICAKGSSGIMKQYAGAADAAAAAQERQRARRRRLRTDLLGARHSHDADAGSAFHVEE